MSEQIQRVLEQYDYLLAKYSHQWEDGQTKSRENKSDISFLDDLAARHEKTTQYFVHLRSSNMHKAVGNQNFRYTDLMCSHITHAVGYFYVAMERLRNGEGRDHYGMPVAAWITEGAHVTFDNMISGKIAEPMKERGFDHPSFVEAAWLVRMLRAILWHRCHVMVDGARVAASHWGSRLPVYIG